MISSRSRSCSDADTSGIRHEEGWQVAGGGMLAHVLACVLFGAISFWEEDFLAGCS